MSGLSRWTLRNSKIFGREAKILVPFQGVNSSGGIQECDGLINWDHALLGRDGRLTWWRVQLSIGATEVGLHGLQVWDEACWVCSHVVVGLEDIKVGLSDVIAWERLACRQLSSVA